MASKALFANTTQPCWEGGHDGKRQAEAENTRLGRVLCPEYSSGLNLSGLQSLHCKMEIISLLSVLNVWWQDKIAQVGRREASLKGIQEKMKGEKKIIANRDKFYFRVLCKGAQRSRRQMEGSGVTGDFLRGAYIIACACGDGYGPVSRYQIQYMRGRVLNVCLYTTPNPCPPDSKDQLSPWPFSWEI